MLCIRDVSHRDVNGSGPEVKIEFFDFVLTAFVITMEFLFTF